MCPPASIPSITSASAPERISFFASASAGAKQTSFAPLALIRSIAPPGGRPPARTTWPTRCFAQVSISSLNCGCMVMRLTPNGRSVRVFVSAISVSSKLRAHRAAGDDSEAAGVGDGGDEVALGNPAHRAAQDRDVAAEELGAAVHQLLEAIVPGGRVDRARIGDQSLAAHAASSASRPKARVQHAHGELEYRPRRSARSTLISDVENGEDVDAAARRAPRTSSRQAGDWSACRRRRC